MVARALNLTTTTASVAVIRVAFLMVSSLRAFCAFSQVPIVIATASEPETVASIALTAMKAVDGVSMLTTSTTSLL